MAQDPKNYRDPKVTTEPRSSNDAMRWVWIAAAIIVVLLFLAWIFGWFGRGTTVTTTTAPPEATQPAPQSAMPPEGTTVGPTTGPGAPADGTAPAGDAGTAPATGPLGEGSAAPTDGTTPPPAPAD
jgi:hypothetical protein